MNTRKFEKKLNEILEDLVEIIEEFPESNEGHDYLCDAAMSIDRVIDEYLD